MNWYEYEKQIQKDKRKVEIFVGIMLILATLGIVLGLVF